MTLYLNSTYQGDTVSLQVASIRGWADFRKWAESVQPANKFKLLRGFADMGVCLDPYTLYDQIWDAARLKPPGQSAKVVANRLLLSLPDGGSVTVSGEPEDDSEG
jgi:hypothetical protein